MSHFLSVVSFRLKNIRSLVNPELLYSLAKMGDRDTILLAGNGFPSERLARPGSLIHADGLCIPSVLTEIMKLIPVRCFSKVLQTFPTFSRVQICPRVKFPILLMKPEEGMKDPHLWPKYKDIIEKAEGRQFQWAKLSRNDFYEEAKKVRRL